MTVRILLKQSQKLSMVFKALYTSMEEVNIRIDALGMNLRGMGNAKVTLTDILIPKSAFDEFPTIEVGSEITFQIKLADPIKILGRSKSEDTLELELTDRTFNFIIHGRYKKTYETSMQAFNKDHDQLPKVTYNNELTVKPGVLDEILGDVKLMTRYIFLEVKNNKLTVNGKARDQNSGTILEFFETDDNIMKVVRNEERAISKYDLEMFSSLVSIFKTLDTDVALEFDSQKPMRMRYIIKDFGSLHHFVAPWIAQADDSSNSEKD
jgi:proliferating cell nuclear antigen